MANEKKVKKEEPQDVQPEQTDEPVETIVVKQHAKAMDWDKIKSCIELIEKDLHAPRHMKHLPGEDFKRWERIYDGFERLKKELA